MMQIVIAGCHCEQLHSASALLPRGNCHCEPKATQRSLAAFLHSRCRNLLFVLVSFGDLLGVPILPPYYSLRLLPYIGPLLNRWRYRMLREKDLTDLVG